MSTRELLDKSVKFPRTVFSTVESSTIGNIIVLCLVSVDIVIGKTSMFAER